jgi:hypothetical protein
VHLHAERHRAIRLVGEAYPFQRFLATADNHNSVNGLREFARARGAETRTCRSRRPSSRGPARGSPRRGRRPQPLRLSRAVQLLGVKHPLEWIDLAHERGWDVLWTAPRSRRRAGSTCLCGSRTSSRSRSTRCSATRRAWAR